MILFMFNAENKNKQTNQSIYLIVLDLLLQSINIIAGWHLSLQPAVCGHLPVNQLVSVVVERHQASHQLQVVQAAA